MKVVSGFTFVVTEPPGADASNTVMGSGEFIVAPSASLGYEPPETTIRTGRLCDFRLSWKKPVESVVVLPKFVALEPSAGLTL